MFAVWGGGAAGWGSGGEVGRWGGCGYYRVWAFVLEGVSSRGLGDGDGRVPGRTDRVCSSINPWSPPASFFSEVDNRNAMVGAGVAVSVENRFILSIVFASWRDLVVSMRNGWIGGR